MGNISSSFLWKHFLITPFVNGFLAVSSVVVFSSLENPIAKWWWTWWCFLNRIHLQVWNSFIYSRLFYNTVLLNLPTWFSSQVFAVLTIKGFSFFTHCILVALSEIFVYDLSAKKWCLLKSDDRFWKRLGYIL